MNRFNRSRANRNSSKSYPAYKVGDLVVYSYNSCYTDIQGCQLMAIVLERTDNQYLIRFLDDGSEMDCWFRELSPVEAS